MPDVPPDDQPHVDDVSVSLLRAWSAVVALAVAVFAVTATEMMPIGVLPQMASGLGISEGAAGLTVTVYGVVAGLSAPAMTSWTRRVDRRTLALSIIGVFVVGNAATAFVSSYAVLLGVRLGIGLVHGLMWSIIVGVALRLVPPASAGRATAAVLSGISLALVLGVPAGAAVGAWRDWHAAFAVLAAITAFSWIAVAALVPALPVENTGAARSVRSLLRVRGGLRTTLVVTALLVVGNYAAYTYIAPFLIDHADRRPEEVSLYLLVYGIAGVTGNFAAGAAVGWASSPRLVLVAVLMVLAASLVVLGCAPITAGTAFVLIAIWGMSYSALPVVLQTLVFSAAPHARDAATSLYVMVFNSAIAAGALAGAVAVNTVAVSGPILLGALLCAAAAAAAVRLSGGKAEPRPETPSIRMTHRRARAPQHRLGYGSEPKASREDDIVGPEQELTLGQKAKMGFQAAGAFARNPKALVALVKYQLAERKRQKAQPEQAATVEE